jgi:hypothetical protein
MRKESIGRLLLSLITAFIMVLGAFGAAVTSFSQMEQPDVPLAAENELDEGTREIGEAPISADIQEQEAQWTAQSEGKDTDRPSFISAREMDDLPENDLYYRESMDEPEVPLAGEDTMYLSQERKTRSPD